MLERALGRYQREREVESSALDQSQQLVLVGRLLQSHLDPGPRLHETPHDIGQHADRDALERPDAQRGGRALGERREIGLCGLQLRGEPDRVAEDALAGVGRNDRPPTAGSLEQAHAGRPLERRDLDADGRLRIAELLRGPRERSGHRDGLERREMTNLDAEQSMMLFHHAGR